MFKQLLVVAFLASAASVALADGPASAYGNNALSPNEEDISEGLVNADGKQEDPSAPMTTTARAFRNGLINGRQMQKDQDAQVNLPPLPPDMPAPAAQPKGYSGFPQAAQVQAIPTQQPRVQQYQPQEPVYQAPPPQYVQRQYTPQPQPMQQPPVQIVNVMPDPRYYERATDFGRAPSWRNRQDAMEEMGYDPYPPAGYQPPPRPVYIAPQPVYEQAPQVVYVQPSGYVRRPAPAYYPYGGYGGSIQARIGRVRLGYTAYGY